MVLATVALTVAASLLFFNVRPESMLAMESPKEMPAIGDPAFITLLEAYLGKSMIGGNSVKLFRDGDEIFPAKLAAIEDARHSITLEVFEFWGERVAGRIADALARKAEEGVKVHVLLDFFGSIKDDPAKFDRMREAGVELIRWRRPSWYQSGRINNRTHRKLLIVDGVVGFTGGANMGDDWWVEADSEDDSYRDNHYQFHGPIVAQLQAAFLDNWLRANNRMLTGHAYFPPLEPVGEKYMQTIVSSPSDGKKRVRSFILLAFSAARERILIQTAYFYPDSVIMDALIQARERGVEVVLLVPGGPDKENIVRFASRNRWGAILEAGVRIHEYQPRVLHAKLFVIDDALVSVGSINFDNRSFRLNDEANVNILCKTFAADMTKVFMDDLAHSTLYDLPRWQARSFKERALGLLGNMVGLQL